MIACLRVLCGSSVYDQKNWSPSYGDAACLDRSSLEEACAVVVTDSEDIISLRKCVDAGSIDCQHDIYQDYTVWS